MAGPADLADLFAPPPATGRGLVTFAQGRITAWDTSTASNTVEVQGTTLSDVAVLGTTELLTLQVGDVVGLLIWQPMPGGPASYFILGRNVVPQVGVPQGITLRGTGGVEIAAGGSLTILEGGDLLIEDGGDVEIADGGSFISRYAGGRMACMFGPLIWISDGTPMGHGLMVQQDDAGQTDVFRVMQMTSGATVLWTGETGSPIDEVNLYATETVVESTSQPLLLIGNSASDVDVSYNGTALAANCYLSAGGRIHRSSSTRRGKADIADLDLDPAAVLAARPRVFRDRADIRGGGPRRGGPPHPRPDTEPPTPPPVDDDGPVVGKGPLVPGFVAEEMHDAGLGTFVAYDQDGEPEGVLYDRLTAGLLLLARQQQQRIDDLTTRVTALETFTRRGT